MEAFSLNRVKILVETFKKYSRGSTFLSKEDFRRIFKTTLTGEYMKFLCDQFSDDYLNWREICLGIALHTFYLVPETVELEEQRVSFDKAYLRLEEEEKTKNHLPKKEFLDCELWIELHTQRKHPKMTKKMVREAVWLIMEKDDLICYSDLMNFFYDDFLPLKTLFNFFCCRKQAFAAEVCEFLQFKIRDKDPEVTNKLVEVFGDSQITFKMFRDSTLGQELMYTYARYLTKKRIDDESEEKFQFVRMSDGENIIQMKSPSLLKHLNSCGYSTTYAIQVVSELLLKNPQLSALELQKALVNEHVLTNPLELENLIVRHVANIMREDRVSHTMNMLVDAVNRWNPYFVETLLSDRSVLMHAIPAKLQKLESELTDREYPLSTSGVEKVQGFKDFFTELLKKLQLEEEEEEKKPIEFSKAQLVEIKKEVVKSYVQTQASLQELRNFICQDPLTEGLELVEFLTHPNSGMKLSSQASPNLIGYVSFNFRRTDLLAIYDFSLMRDKQREVIMKVGHFLSLEDGELDQLLCRAVTEVALKMRPFIAINGLSTLESEHWVALFIREAREGGLQLLACDSFNGRRPVGEIVGANEEKLHATYIYNKFVKPISEGVKAMKEVFVHGGKKKKKKKRFLDELEGVLEIEEFLPRFIVNVLEGKKEEEKMEDKFRFWVYEFMRLWRVFLEKGTIKSMKDLVMENLEIKKELRELKQLVEKLKLENEVLKKKE